MWCRRSPRSCFSAGASRSRHVGCAPQPPPVSVATRPPANRRRRRRPRHRPRRRRPCPRRPASGHRPSLATEWCGLTSSTPTRSPGAMPRCHDRTAIFEVRRRYATHTHTHAHRLFLSGYAQCHIPSDRAPPARTAHRHQGTRRPTSRPERARLQGKRRARAGTRTHPSRPPAAYSVYSGSDSWSRQRKPGQLQGLRKNRCCRRNARTPRSPSERAHNGSGPPKATSSQISKPRQRAQAPARERNSGCPNFGRATPPRATPGPTSYSRCP